MKKSRDTESQIIAELQEVDAGKKVEEVCRQHGISSAIYYNWKSKYGGMEAYCPLPLNWAQKQYKPLNPSTCSPVFT